MGGSIELTSVSELADLVIARARNGRTVTAVAGPPGSGKSTTAESLVDVLNRRQADSASVFSLDGYHYDDLVLEARGDRSRKGAPHTFDVAGFASTLDRLRANAEPEIAVPVFDRSIEIARAGARLIDQSVIHLVVEGNYLLLNEPPWIGLAPQFDTTVFIKVPETELRRRLLERWSDLSGAALEAKLDGNDFPNARLVMTNSRPADAVLVQGAGDHR